MKLSIYFVILFVVHLPTIFVFGVLTPGSPIVSVSTNTTDWIESYPEYHSYINWTQGYFRTTYTVPITYNDRNIGRNIANLTEKLQEKITQFVIGSITKIRVSSIFSIQDFFYKDQDFKYQLLSLIYDRPLENTVTKNSYLYGKITVPLFGTNSITELLYQNIQQKKITNYLRKETVGTQYYDTLIIDTIMFPNFKASLMSKILDHKGDIVYGVETVDLSILKKTGPIQFVTSITEALNHPVRGNNVAYLLPKNISGSLSSDIILFEEDIYRIFSQQRTINQLNLGKVIVIIPKERL